MKNLSVILKEHADQWKDLMAVIDREATQNAKIREVSLAAYNGEIHKAPELVKKQILEMEKRFDEQYKPQSGALARALTAKQNKELEPYQAALKQIQSIEEMQRRALELQLQKQKEEQEKTH